LRDRALTVRPGGHETPVVSRDDLIRMKQASGRSVDVEDVAALTEPEHRHA
jgi:hypothetical protein